MEAAKECCIALWPTQAGTAQLRAILSTAAEVVLHMYSVILHESNHSVRSYKTVYTKMEAWEGAEHLLPHLAALALVMFSYSLFCSSSRRLSPAFPSSREYSSTEPPSPKLYTLYLPGDDTLLGVPVGPGAPPAEGGDHHQVWEEEDAPLLPGHVIIPSQHLSHRHLFDYSKSDQSEII